MRSASVFIGRRRELEALEQGYRSKQSALVPIYGRRRVGKSALILQFLEKKPAIYHVGKRAPAALQIHEFLQAAATTLREPLLTTLPASDWKLALATVVERWKRREKRTRLWLSVWTFVSPPRHVSRTTSLRPAPRSFR